MKAIGINDELNHFLLTLENILGVAVEEKRLITVEGVRGFYNAPSSDGIERHKPTGQTTITISIGLKNSATDMDTK